MKIISVTQMRMGSGRLPGKALIQIGGKTVLELIVERLRSVSKIDEVVIATSNKSENDLIEDLCKKIGVTCFRGSEEDVLGRTAGAASAAGADLIVQVYGDGPFICSDVISYMLEQYDGISDWVGNSMKTTFPPGQEVEIIKNSAYQKADKLSQGSPMREHATLFMREHPEIFKILSIEAPEHWRFPELFLELDEQSDLEFLDALAKKFNNHVPNTLHTILDSIRKYPELYEINSNVARRWKQFRE